MRDSLKVRNEHLRRDVLQLIQEVDAAEVPRELDSYAERIKNVSVELFGSIDQNLSDLALNQEDILEEVLSNTEQALYYLRLISSTMVVPIIRSSQSDRLSLKLVSWLHQEHPNTRDYPPAVSTGDCSILPFIQLCPIYFFPAVEQKVLLYQPLFFHEFGHLLYRCHQRELDELVHDLQRDIGKILTPRSYRSDKHFSLQRNRRQNVLETWYGWAQELFCDAIGMVIGGPSFLWSFSTYMGTLGRSDFYRPPSSLKSSTHPVTWLRIKLLLSQARTRGLIAEADAIEDEWRGIAGVMGIDEDYHGYYDEAFNASILRMLQDAITEVGPREYLPKEIEEDVGTPHANATPVALTNRAWHAFFSGEIDYQEWETKATCSWIGE